MSKWVMCDRCGKRHNPNGRISKKCTKKSNAHRKISDKLIYDDLYSGYFLDT